MTGGEFQARMVDLKVATASTLFGNCGWEEHDR